MNFFCRIVFFATITCALLSCQKKTSKLVFESSTVDLPTKLGVTKLYKLKKKVLNSDFDYEKIFHIDDARDSLDLRRVFEPVNGNHIYYQFVATGE